MMQTNDLQTSKRDSFAVRRPQAYSSASLFLLQYI